MLNRKGIFLTFMAFLLASTVLAISISISQAEIRQGQNLADKAAFMEANSRFRNIRQQAIVTKEGYAGWAYGRFMPFKRFKAGENWFELEQKLPAAGVYLQNTYDALGFFKVFAEEKGSQGLRLEVGSLVHNSDWVSDAEAEPFPKLEYVVLPQCLKFSVGEGTETGIVKFEGGTTDDCEEGFDGESIERYEVGLRLESSPAAIQCGGDFDDGGTCKQLADDSTGHYAIVEIFLSQGTTPWAVVSANISQPSNTYVDIIYIGGNTRLGFTSNHVIEITKDSQSETETLKARTEFTKPIDEIVLVPGLFEFSVEKPGFGLCRATQEAGCAS